MSMLLRGSSTESDLYRDDSEEHVKSTWHYFWKYIYNPQKKTFCMRTPKEWSIMGFYYLAYTTFIVALFLAFLYVSKILIQLSTDEFPLIDKAFLLDGSFPGLGLVPSIVNTKFPIIWYSPDPNEQMTEQLYIDELNTFFAKYNRADRTKYEDCELGKNGTKPCYFDMKRLGDCNGKRYHYTNSSLCFFLKLNRLMNWTPVYYQNKNDLLDIIPLYEVKQIIASSKKNLIYVECDGRNFWDKEFIGNITYYPQKGFNGSYFPYNGQSDYLSPVIGVKLDNITTGVVIHIRCTVWSKNINTKSNHLHLKIFVDNTLPY